MPWKIKYRPRGEKKFKLWPHKHANKYTASRRVKKLKMSGFEAYAYKARKKK